MSAIAALPLIVSQFPTAMPTAKEALGDMEQKTWGDLRAMLSVRREGQKDGPNLVFARFKLEAKQPHGQTSKQSVRRLKINVEARTAIALDVDGNKETGEVAPALRDISQRITAQGWAALLYTSHSHSAKAPRYRIVLPLNAEIPPHLPAVEAVADILGLSGVLDKSKLGASSVFYLPSSEPGKRADHHAGEIEGRAIDAEWITDRAGDILAERDRVQAEIRAAAMAESERRRAAKIKAGFKPTEKLIEAIRDRLDLAGELLRHGYVQQGDRYLYSGSETGIPGVHILRGSDGVERVFSHHSGDPLAAGNLPAWCSVKAVDAVDVVAILDFGGDFTKALRELGTRFGIGEPLKAKAPPEEPPGFADVPPHDDAGHTHTQDEAPADRIIPGLADFLSAATWAKRDLPEPDRLLGDLVTTDSRVFLVGTTGLGKTMLGFALGYGMATGIGFLHWRSVRPARVLYLDGEMSSALVKVRCLAEMNRSNPGTMAGALIIYARDFDEQTDKAFPQIGKMPPLNTEAGHTFVRNLIASIGGVDVVILDNVMSLLSGDMREEESWTNTQPLVAWLSAKRIGQIWFDHTGHDKTRQYGSSTKAWRFDAVGVMTPLGDDDRAPGELAFQLSFESPGKARRRTPDNWPDFAPTTIRLIDDRWTGEQAAGARTVRAKVSPVALALHRALLDALAVSDTPGQTTRDGWHAEGARLGLLDAYADDDNRATRDRKRAKLRKYMTELKAAGWIGVDGETVRDLQSGERK